MAKVLVINSHIMIIPDVPAETQELFREPLLDIEGAQEAAEQEVRRVGLRVMWTSFAVAAGGAALLWGWW